MCGLFYCGLHIFILEHFLSTAEKVRECFHYDEATGRLTRVKRGRGAKTGKEIGETGNGWRRAYFDGKNRQTAHLVWAWHYGSLPDGGLKHINGDDLDDRIENLESSKKKLKVAYIHDGTEVTEYGRLPKGINSGIYEIVCIENGRRYIGSAVKLEHRWRLHYTQLCAGAHHSRHLQRAWSKYGEAGFIFRVIETCEKHMLLTLEQEAIDRVKPEFNSRPMAASQLGFRHSEESRKKMSESRPKDFSPMRGKRHSEETKERISIAKTGVRQSKETVRRRAEAIKAKLGRQSAKKFSEYDIKVIRARLIAGDKNIKIAAEYGVSDSVISEIRNRKAYRWVE